MLREGGRRHVEGGREGGDMLRKGVRRYVDGGRRHVEGGREEIC